MLQLLLLLLRWLFVVRFTFITHLLQFTTVYLFVVLRLLFVILQLLQLLRLFYLQFYVCSILRLFVVIVTVSYSLRLRLFYLVPVYTTFQFYIFCCYVLLLQRLQFTGYLLFYFTFCCSCHTFAVYPVVTFYVGFVYSCWLLFGCCFTLLFTVTVYLTVPFCTLLPFTTLCCLQFTFILRCSVVFVLFILFLLHLLLLPVFVVAPVAFTRLQFYIRSFVVLHFTLPVLHFVLFYVAVTTFAVYSCLQFCCWLFTLQFGCPTVTFTFRC